MVGLQLRENSKEKKLWIRFKRYLLWGLAVCWMGCIFYLSHQPARASSELSAGVTAIIFEWVQLIVPIDLNMSAFHTFIRKAAHFSAYFLLGMLFYIALGRVKKRWFKALLLSVLYAVTDEVHQLFIPGRSGEVRDVFIDGIGATIGIVFTTSIKRLGEVWKR